MNVLLLAAGEGTRLRPHTYLRPKPAIPFLNVPLAAYPLSFLEDLRIDRLVVNTFHLPTKVVDLFVHLPHGARHLHFSHEVETILGNGGGLGYARDYFLGQGDLVLMNSDEVILPLHREQMVRAMEQHKSSGAICTLVTMDHPGVGTQFGGVWLNERDEVVGFGKTSPVTSGVRAEHFIGVQILSEEIFAYIPNGEAANILYDGVTRALADGRKVQRYKIECQWFETGNLADYLEATSECLHLLADNGREGNPRRHLKSIIEKFTKEPVRIDRSVKGLTLLKHSSAVIEDLSSLSGFAVAGANSLVPRDCVLKNTVIAANTALPAGTTAANQLFLEA